MIIIIILRVILKLHFAVLITAPSTDLCYLSNYWLFIIINIFISIALFLFGKPLGIKVSAKHSKHKHKHKHRLGACGL